MPHVPARIALALLVGAVIALAPGGPAQAHVSVSPAQAPPGGFTTLTFRVPNERAEAATTSVRIVMPETTPITSAAVHKLAGWRATVEDGPLATPVKVGSATVTEAITSVTWTAATAEDAIDGTQFQEFSVSVGPLPTTGDRVVFKALQTYADGVVSRWIEEPTPGGPEPDNPAIVLRLDEAAATGVDEHGMPVAGAPTTAAVADRPAGVALAVAVAGVVLGAAALLLGLLNRTLGRRIR
ncbi:YcnI family protein [Micromonospora sp. WMMD1155]|uniref:YcnI family copper-binding membrane protein n=1 Tax=Micromonospora sp. WMMD1155 TaxID=3016094 RepID=UPI00249A4B01|nr:YcnI family protein [Micromonospora sp. WMMD1155]WFE53139.1 YcnI family protein [Micromonospora sp. WMMD1155]